MKAHIYIRVSTDEQAEDGYSLHAQDRACRLYCELHSVTVGDSYIDDGYTGTNGNRPGFAHLLASVQPGDLVVVHKLDRFARNTALLLSTLASFDERGIRLVSVSEQIDFSTPIGRVMLTLLGSFAQYYSDNLRTETTKGLQEKARRGLWVGSVPYGYQKVNNNKGVIIPSDDADVVRMIYRLFVQGYSYTRLVAYLNDHGYQAYDWQTRTRHPFTRETVRTILRNRAYAGYVSCGGAEYPGQHEPLVSAETWQAAADRRAAYTRAPGPARHAARYPGLFYCARCGRRLWFKYGGRSDNTRSYYCSGRGACDAPQFRAELVEDQVDDLLDLLSIESVEQVLHAVWCVDGEIVSVEAQSKYQRLLSALGWPKRPRRKKSRGAF